MSYFEKYPISELVSSGRCFTFSATCCTSWIRLKPAEMELPDEQQFSTGGSGPERGTNLSFFMTCINKIHLDLSGLGTFLKNFLKMMKQLVSNLMEILQKKKEKKSILIL